MNKTNETIIQPIYGVCMPFHISSLTNLTSWSQEDFSYLRLSFCHPDAAAANASNEILHENFVHVKDIFYRQSNIKTFGVNSATNSIII